MTIKAGSVVRLKSGGPLMTVGEVDGKGAGREAACIWHPKVNGEWIIDTAEETIPLSMLEEAGPDEEIDEALTDACTERDMLAARLKEVEAERDALRNVGLAVCDQLLGEDLDPADLERLLKLQSLCTKAVA